MTMRLKRVREPDWVDIGQGAALFCAPPTSPLVHAARAEAAKLFIDLLDVGEVVTKVGGRIEGLPDLSDPERARASQDALFVVSLAELAVTDWRGVTDDPPKPKKPKAIPFDPGLLAVLLEDHEVTDRFMLNYLHSRNEVVAEGNV